MYYHKYDLVVCPASASLSMPADLFCSIVISAFSAKRVTGNASDGLRGGMLLRGVSSFARVTVKERCGVWRAQP